MTVNSKENKLSRDSVLRRRDGRVQIIDAFRIVLFESTQLNRGNEYLRVGELGAQNATCCMQKHISFILCVRVHRRILEEADLEGLQRLTSPSDGEVLRKTEISSESVPSQLRE